MCIDNKTLNEHDTKSCWWSNKNLFTKKAYCIFHMVSQCKLKQKEKNLKLGNPLNSKSKFTKSIFGQGGFPSMDPLPLWKQFYCIFLNVSQCKFKHKETILKRGNPLKSKSKFAKSIFSRGSLPPGPTRVLYQTPSRISLSIILKSPSVKICSENNGVRKYLSLGHRYLNSQNYTQDLCMVVKNCFTCL
jgi:hypothetical protein